MYDRDKTLLKSSIPLSFANIRTSVLDYSLEHLDLSYMPRLSCAVVMPGLADADNSTPSNS